MPRANIIGLGWALTATIWMFAGLMMLSVVVRDDGGHIATLLIIAAGAIAFNAMALGGVTCLLRRAR